VKRLSSFLAIALSVWCVVYLSHVLDYIGILIAPNQHQAIFLGILLFLTFLVFPAKQGKAIGKWYDWILILMGVIPCGYLVFFYDLWILHGATTTETYELVFCLALSIALLEALRRAVGIILSVLTIFFLLHPLLSAYLPGILFGRGYSLERVGTMVYFQPNGIFSLPLNIAATIVIAFLIFGQLLLVTGGGQALINMALSIVGRVRGGGAKSAIVASSLFGTISGAPTANVAITGTFTIPLMKSSGYKPNFAGGVEACASTAGTVMPPVMGTVSFIMADWLGIPYITIAIMALLPAIILYLGMFIQVDLAAARQGLHRIPSANLPSFIETFKRSLIFLLPVLLLIYLLFGLKYSPQTSALWAAISVGIVTVFRRESRLTLTKIVNAMTESARASVIVGLACAMAGIMMGSVAMTGIAASLTGILVKTAAGNLFILLLLAALASFVFGMGIGSIPSYIFVAIMVAPALTEMGQPMIVSHLFVFWIAMSAFITPPVCVSAYIAASIAGGSPMRTGFQAVRIGIGFLLVPFAFVYNPEIILQGSASEIVMAAIAVAMGIAAISVGMEGYLLRRMNWWEIGLFLICGIIIIFSIYWIRLAALAIILAMVLRQIKDMGGLHIGNDKESEKNSN
jgi:TRAP transporter 4TM/12TM fusion protein